MYVCNTYLGSATVLVIIMRRSGTVHVGSRQVKKRDEFSSDFFLGIEVRRRGGKRRKASDATDQPANKTACHHRRSPLAIRHSPFRRLLSPLAFVLFRERVQRIMSSECSYISKAKHDGISYTHRHTIHPSIHPSLRCAETHHQTLPTRDQRQTQDPTTQATGVA